MSSSRGVFCGCGPSSNVIATYGEPTDTRENEMPPPWGTPAGRFMSGLRGTGPRTAGVRYAVLATVFTDEAGPVCATVRGLSAEQFPSETLSRLSPTMCANRFMRRGIAGCMGGRWADYRPGFASCHALI